MNNSFVNVVKSLFKSYGSLISRNIRFSSTYKAAAIVKPGEPLQLIERQVVKLKPNQVRLQVVYCSLNSIDCQKFRQESGEFPFIPGYEFSGEVLERGNNVKNEQFIVGDRVAGLSLNNFGALAEQCIVDVDDAWRLPSELERKDAAVLAYGHSTALYTFSKLAQLKENERVLISAGPAGFGLAAIDVAANVFKAKVIALVDNEELGELVRQRGAFETLTFSDNLQKKCMKITNNKGVHVIYDAVGDFMLEPVQACVSVGGKIFHATPVFYKTLPAPIPHSFVTIVSLKELRRQNLHMYKTIVGDTFELANEGMISAHISAEFNLEKINDAVKFIEDKKCAGKILIHIDD